MQNNDLRTYFKDNTGTHFNLAISKIYYDSVRKYFEDTVKIKEIEKFVE